MSFSNELDHGVIAGYPGEGPLRISIQKIFHGQVSGNDSCLFIHDTLIDAAEKLGGYKAVGQLCAQIINDEQITVVDKRSHIRRLGHLFGKYFLTAGRRDRKR